MPRSREWPLSAFGFRAGRAIAGACPPRYGLQGRLRFTVGRGPVPRHASVEETALVGVRFSRESNARGGQAPATVCKAVSVYRRARACPSPCLGRGNGLCLRSVFARVERSRGTGPRATGPGGVLLAMRRSGAGAPELRSLVHAGDRGGLSPALRLKKVKDG